MYNIDSGILFVYTDVHRLWAVPTCQYCIWELHQYGQSIWMVSIPDRDSTNATNHHQLCTTTRWSEMFREYVMWSRIVQICKYVVHEQMPSIITTADRNWFRAICYIFSLSKLHIRISRFFVKKFKIIVGRSDSMDEAFIALIGMQNRCNKSQIQSLLIESMQSIDKCNQFPYSSLVHCNSLTLIQ